MKLPKNSSGFSLMEIMVVLGIGLALSSIIIFSISSAKQKSRDAKRISDISQLRLALESFYDACGSYPNQLVTTASNGCAGSTNFGKFIGQIPTDPSSGSGYYYFAKGTGADCFTYHIGATLQDGSHAELNNDNDVTVDMSPACTSGGTWQSGAGAVYDFIPGI